MDLSLAVAQGFHNAPRLYGDHTVRTAPRVSGIQSGLRAAGSEFTLGIYDGVTGLFIQPYNGARQRGAIGFVQGMGKGVGGLVLKSPAAIIAPFGYTMKGVHKELVKGRQPTAFIRKARIIKGLQDMHALDDVAKASETAKVDAAWRIVLDIRKEDEAHKQQGVKGRVAVFREQRVTDKQGPYENVGDARRALQSKQEGRKEQESLAVARNSGEERRVSRIVGKKRSIFRLRNKGGDSESGKERRNSGYELSGSNGSGKPTKGTERKVGGDVHDWGKRLPEKHGKMDGLKKERREFANHGSASVAA